MIPDLFHKYPRMIAAALGVSAILANDEGHPVLAIGLGMAALVMIGRGSTPYIMNPIGDADKEPKGN